MPRFSLHLAAAAISSAVVSGMAVPTAAEVSIPRDSVAARSCPAGSPMEAMKLAERAAAVLAAEGRAAAFARYRRPGGPFVRGDLYVFVVAMNGVIILNVGFPEVVGRGGFGLRTQLARVIRDGRGWIRYRWYNPCSRRMEQKMSYLVRVGELIVGVGAYGGLSV